MIKLITLGKIKEQYFKDAILEYSKRITRFDKIEIVELNDLSIPENPSEKEIDKILDSEAYQILNKINQDDYLFVLAIEGQLIDSNQLSESIRNIKIEGHSNIVFVIGSSYGLSEKVKQRADKLISFGKITLPHQLIRVVLVEQIYRALMIDSGSTYHK